MLFQTHISHTQGVSHTHRCPDITRGSSNALTLSLPPKGQRPVLFPFHRPGD